MKMKKCVFYSYLKNKGTFDQPSVLSRRLTWSTLISKLKNKGLEEN